MLTRSCPAPFKSVATVPEQGARSPFNILYQTPITPRAATTILAGAGEAPECADPGRAFASGNGGWEKLPAIVASGDIPDLSLSLARHAGRAERQQVSLSRARSWT
ncbi:MAG: hypothetical protein U0232_19105 [Thermomicrobiales bacterium]